MNSKSFAHSPAPVVGILLVYYQAYAQSAVTLFSRFMASLAPGATLVVVKNSDIALPEVDACRLEVVDGDNSLREFSGWQSGVAHCRASGLVDDSSLIVFANDTFCHHNKFGPITRMAFRRSFRRMLFGQTGLVLVGEVYDPGERYSIQGQAFSEWVLLYLFAMPVTSVERVGGLSPPFDLDAVFTGEAKSDNFFSDGISDNLKKQITSWLFGLSRRTRWYGAEPLTEANLHRFIGKSKSILSEMHLSAKVQAAGGLLVSVFDAPWLRQARRLERLIPRYAQAGKKNNR